MCSLAARYPPEDTLQQYLVVVDALQACRLFCGKKETNEFSRVKIAQGTSLVQHHPFEMWLLRPCAY